MKKIILLVILCIFASFATVSAAEKKEWIDKSFNFTKVRTVFIYDSVFPDKLKNGIDEKETEESYFNKSNLKNVKILRFRDIVSIYKARTGVDLFSIANPQEATEEFCKTVLTSCDAYILAKVIAYGTSQVYNEGYDYAIPTTQTSQVYGTGGYIGSVQTQTSQNVHVAGGMETSYNTGVRFDMYSTATCKPVITRIEFRSNSPRLFNQSKNRALFEHIVETFYEELDEKISNK